MQNFVVCLGKVTVNLTGTVQARAAELLDEASESSRALGLRLRPNLSLTLKVLVMLRMTSKRMQVYMLQAVQSFLGVLVPACEADLDSVQSYAFTVAILTERAVFRLVWRQVLFGIRVAHAAGKNVQAFLGLRSFGGWVLFGKPR